VTLVRFLRNQEGTVALIAGAAIATTVGIAAFTVDLSNAYSVKGRLQNAADAAALAAAQKLPKPDEEDWEEQTRALALQLVDGNVGRGDGQVATPAEIVFGRYDPASRQFASDAEPFNAVKVTTRRTAAAGNAVQTYFGGIFGVDQIDVQTEAIAMKSAPGTCVYALDENASAALEVAGAASLSASNCNIQINSAAPDAAVTRGRGTVEAASTRVVGDYDGRGFSPAPETNAPALRDPMAEVPEPAQPGPCHMTDFEINTSQILPSNRTYCGSASFSGNSKIELEPGLYYFKDADVQISSSSFIGKDVLIFLDANSTIHISGNGTHELSAAETGPYAGIVLYQSRDADNPINKKSGNSKLVLSGAIYMPGSTFQIRGTGNVEAEPGKIQSGEGKGDGQRQAQGQVEGQDAAEGQAEKKGEENEQGEDQENAAKEEKKPVFVTEIEYVIAYRFDLAGNANFRVGRQGAAAAAYAVLVY
jgi:hypothetical protein